MIEQFQFYHKTNPDLIFDAQFVGQDCLVSWVKEEDCERVELVYSKRFAQIYIEDGLWIKI